MAVGAPHSAGYESTTLRSKRRDLVELCVGYGLILVVIWTPRPWQQRIYFVAAVFIVATTWARFQGLRAMGLRSTNLLRSLWIVGAALLVCGASALVAWRLDTLHAPNTVPLFVSRYAGYVLFAFVQQALMQDYFLPRLTWIFPRAGTAVLAAATIFSLAHLPNPILTGITFFWGLASCFLFVRYRNLYPLAVAHAILGITVAMSIPGPVVRNMRVGLGYLTYSPYQVHHRSH